VIPTAASGVSNALIEFGQAEFPPPARSRRLYAALARSSASTASRNSRSCPHHVQSSTRAWRMTAADGSQGHRPDPGARFGYRRWPPGVSPWLAPTHRLQFRISSGASRLAGIEARPACLSGRQVGGKAPREVPHDSISTPPAPCRSTRGVSAHLPRASSPRPHRMQSALRHASVSGGPGARATQRVAELPPLGRDNRLAQLKAPTRRASLGTGCRLPCRLRSLGISFLRLATLFVEGRAQTRIRPTQRGSAQLAGGGSIGLAQEKWAPPEEWPGL